MTINVSIPSGNVEVQGSLVLPKTSKGIVIFAHGSGSSRFSPRNQYVAKELQKQNLATLLMDLLTPDEEAVDEYTREFRFDIQRLAARLIDASAWLRQEPKTKDLKQGYFGSSTGAAAALVAAAQNNSQISAVVSRGGRPDLAGALLPSVTAPTLLIVGGFDSDVIALNQSALDQLRCLKKLVIVPGATHLFEEPGKLEEVARLAGDWFTQTLPTNNT